MTNPTYTMISDREEELSSPMILSPFHTTPYDHRVEDVHHHFTPTTLPWAEDPMEEEDPEENSEAHSEEDPDEDPDEESEAPTDDEDEEEDPEEDPEEDSNEEEEVTPASPPLRMFGPTNIGTLRFRSQARKRVHLPQPVPISSSAAVPPLSPSSPLPAPTSPSSVSPSLYFVTSPPGSPMNEFLNPTYAPLSPEHTPSLTDGWGDPYENVAPASPAPAQTLPELAQRVTDQHLRIDHLEDVVDHISDPTAMDSLRWDVHGLEHDVLRLEGVTEYLTSKIPSIDRNRFNEDHLARMENQLDRMQAQINATNEMIASMFRRQK